MTTHTITNIIDFFLEDENPSYVKAYTRALEILSEDCKDDWTPVDAVNTIKRAILLREP